jgi:hypothetical protein
MIARPINNLYNVCNSVYILYIYIYIGWSPLSYLGRYTYIRCQTLLCRVVFNRASSFFLQTQYISKSHEFDFVYLLALIFKCLNGYNSIPEVTSISSTRLVSLPTRLFIYNNYYYYNKRYSFFLLFLNV